MVIIAGVFVFLYIYQQKNQNTNTTTTEDTNFLANFLPFGNKKTTTGEDKPSSIDISIEENNKEETPLDDKKLKKVSSFPVAGYGVFNKERFKEIPVPDTSIEATENIKPTAPTTEFTPALRYVNKATGNIYQTFADRIDERIFSSTIIPTVYEAFFGNKGESVVMRYLKGDNKTIETFVGTLPKEFLGGDGVEASEMKGGFLPENISDMSVSSDASKMFYLFNTNDVVSGITLSFSNNTKIQIFDSPFTEWLSFWPNDKMITITTKPSYSVPGFMYAINPEKKDLNKILGNINGLTTLTSPNGKTVLYSSNTLSLNLFDIDSRNSNSLGIKTLPEKCVWGEASDTLYCAVPKFIEGVQYPDSWYQGEVSFSDEIWKIDVKNGNNIKILDPSEVGGVEEIDAIKLNLDENQNYLFFMNKKDSYLWELQLK